MLERAEPKLRAPAPGVFASYLRAVGAVIWKDLTAEWRSRELLGAMLVFALLVILIFNFALELDIRTRQSVTAGVLWVTFAFAGTLGLNRAMAVERERSCLDGLLLAPVDRSAIFFGKALGNLLFMLIVAAIILPVYSLLYNVNLFHPALAVVIVLGSIGYVIVGTLFSVMAVQARTRELLLPILLFPVVLPVLIAAVRATNSILLGIPIKEIRGWLNLLIVYDLLFTAVAIMTFDYVVEE
ncbi:MAG: heme exporter protein CcmB [Anaerolineales bacterium]